MDSFEINKILGALLFTCLCLLSLNIAAGGASSPALTLANGYVPDYLVNSGSVIFAAQEHRIKTPPLLRIPETMLGDRPAVEAWLAEHAAELQALAEAGQDELLYRMDTQQHRTADKLQTAADFLAELSTLAYSLDPNHVNVIKEPRDLYIPPFNAAIQKARALPGQPDPQTYVVFGVDVYGHPDDVTAAIIAAKQNAEQRMGIAFLVAEYGPFEEPEKDRATYYGEIWDAVYADSPNGGLVYVFGPDQPNPQFSNPYDPLHLLPNPFSLVDNQDNPIDNALATLAARSVAVLIRKYLAFSRATLARPTHPHFVPFGKHC